VKWNKKDVIKRLKELERDIGRRPVKKDNSNLYALSRKYFGSWNNMMKEAGYVIKDFQDPLIPSLKSDDLYYFLGLVCTDGHIQFIKKGGKYKLMVYTSEKEEKEIIIKLINILFNYNAHFRARKTPLSRRPNYEIYITSKKVCEFLNRLGVPYGAKSYTLIVPNILKNVSNDKFWHFLRGIFDGDGSIIITKKVMIFRIYSGSKKFTEGLQQIMETKGIYSSNIYKHKDNVWVLVVNKREEIKKLYNYFYRNALFFYPRKKNKWTKQYL